MVEPLKQVEWGKLLALAMATDPNERALLGELLPPREADRQEILLAIAEVEHRLRGSVKCSSCHAPVRTVMHTISVDESGQTREFECLCRRCLEAEKAYSRKVTSYVAGIVFDVTENQKEVVQRPLTATRKAA